MSAHPLSTALRPGTGRAVFDVVDARTVATSLRSDAPLRLLQPKNHGHAAWVFAATLGGGFVDGDQVELELELRPGAWALLGTQASTKLYRAPTRGTTQKLHARIARDAALVVLSDPVVPFRDSRHEQTSDFVLEAGASLLCVDLFSCGRRAHGEAWDLTRYAARTRISRAGSVTLDDRIALDPTHGALAARMGRFDVVATVFAIGPAFAAIAERARATPVRAGRPRVVTGASPTEGGVVARVAGESVELVQAEVRAWLAPLAGLLGDDPFARKW